MSSTDATGPRRRTFSSYENFWPYYVAMHSKSSTRWIHLVGTLTGAGIALTGLLTGRPRRLAAFPLLGYGAAWPAHFLIEKNNPASFGYPAWAFRGDLQMIRMMLQGQDAELGRIAAEFLANDQVIDLTAVAVGSVDVTVQD